MEFLNNTIDSMLGRDQFSQEWISPKLVKSCKMCVHLYLCIVENRCISFFPKQEFLTYTSAYHISEPSLCYFFKDKIAPCEGRNEAIY